jgi:hypothetical protein
MFARNRALTQISQLLIVCMLLAACVATPLPSTPTIIQASLTPTSLVTQAPSETPSLTPASTSTPSPAPIHFAVIGDFGEGNQAEADVAALVHGWNPDFVITVGDNNYPLGEASTIDDRIGKYYHDFIFPYTGKFGPGATENRFFPTLGNHDWYTDGAKPYLE